MRMRMQKMDVYENVQIVLYWQCSFKHVHVFTGFS